MKQGKDLIKKGAVQLDDEQMNEVSGGETLPNGLTDVLKTDGNCKNGVILRGICIQPRTTTCKGCKYAG